eukprot:13844930-Alexandrium_andersonii.AAC.1
MRERMPPKHIPDMMRGASAFKHLSQSTQHCQLAYAGRRGILERPPKPLERGCLEQELLGEPQQGMPGLSAQTESAKARSASGV